jgi:excisionase family DNA binding protein
MRIATEGSGRDRYAHDLPSQSIHQNSSERVTISSSKGTGGGMEVSRSVASDENALRQESLNSEDRLLRATEIQRELGVSRATAYRMMTDGTLPTYRFGGRGRRREMIRVSLKELRTWIAARRTMSPGAA